MTEEKHLTTAELEAGLDAIRQAPKDEGIIALIVRRPQVDAREVLEEGELDLVEGLVGDTWKVRASNRTPDGSPHPDMQLNVMNARVIALVAQEKDRWPLAGDQLFIDMDVSQENLPPGTRLALGSAVIEVTDQPHTGCKEIRGAVWVGRVKVGQLSCRKTTSVARRERQGNAQPGVIRLEIW